MAAPQHAASISSIGIPREIKRDEQRVALTPDAVRELVSQGLEVRIERDAGAGAGIDDATFESCTSSEELANGLLAERQNASAQGVRSTPTFAIDGQLYPGSLSIEEFSEIIDPLLAKQ